MPPSAHPDTGVDQCKPDYAYNDAKAITGIWSMAELKQGPDSDVDQIYQVGTGQGPLALIVPS